MTAVYVACSLLLYAKAICQHFTLVDNHILDCEIAAQTYLNSPTRRSSTSVATADRVFLKGESMLLFHRTFHAEAILDGGFRDSPHHIADWDGVWFADSPLDENAGADGDTVVSIELPDSTIAQYEVVEDGKSYREWFMPAALANSAGRPTIVEDHWQGQTEVS